MRAERTIQQLIEDAQSELRLFDSARLDAELLLQKILDCPRSYLYAHPEQCVHAEETARFEELIKRRQIGEPIAYITGFKSFWDFDLKVNKATLIPRDDTETLVRLALEKIPVDAGWRVADLGTGTGAIAIAIAHERPRCQLIATDVNKDALLLAKENANRFELMNISFIHSDWFSALSDQHFDIILSNPPYIEEADPHIDGPGVRFEPKQALTSGRDGLDAIREISAKAKTCLKQNGLLILEHGYNQAMKVSGILKLASYTDIKTHRDLSNQERVTSARRA